MTRHMAKDGITTRMEHTIMATGLKTCSMAMVLSNGWMVLCMMGRMSSARSTEWASSHSLMAVTMSDNFKAMTSTAKDNISGQMANITTANGVKIKCTAKEL